MGGACSGGQKTSRDGSETYGEVNRHRRRRRRRTARTLQPTRARSIARPRVCQCAPCCRRGGPARFGVELAGCLGMLWSERLPKDTHCRPLDGVFPRPLTCTRQRLQMICSVYCSGLCDRSVAARWPASRRQPLDTAKPAPPRDKAGFGASLAVARTGWRSDRPEYIGGTVEMPTFAAGRCR